jgi:hypothetical protein
MSSNELGALISEAIFSAFVNHPKTADGATIDYQFKSREDSNHMAFAVLYALDQAGLTIVPKVK